MKILIVGSGGREHAIAWRLRQDDPLVELFIAPGNAGTAQIGNNVPISATDIPGLLKWAQNTRPHLTVVGPEGALCMGIVDAFESNGLPTFGPNTVAARLEGSKLFTKQLLLKHNLPTSDGKGFSEPADAYAYSQTRPYPQVIKADGLAFGKGVIIANTPLEAVQAIHKITEERAFGNAGSAVVIEDFLYGREMSLHVLSDGTNFQLLPIAQDHKRLRDLDTGPNTGGMGAYAPLPSAHQGVVHQLAEEIVKPSLAAFRAENIDFRGILFIGIIWTAKGPQILEYNVRGGDPETQVILPLIATPLIDLLQAVRNRDLGNVPLQIHSDRHVVSVILAAEGYPEKPVLGKPIEGLNHIVKDTVVFHSGTRLENNEIVTNGGRVLSVTGWADNIAHARELAYQRAALIRFPGRQLRHDIAARTTLE